MGAAGAGRVADLWWLLRVTPPAPRREVFPAIRLLLGLTATAETPARTPWWLLALRVLAAGLVIVGLARPVLDAGARLPGAGPLLLVMDDGWAAAPDWPRRQAAATAVLDRVERAGRPAMLLTTAPSETATPPEVTPAMPVSELRPRIAALRPKPWPSDRAAAAVAMRAVRAGSAVYLSDGLTDGPGWNEFATALASIGPVTELRTATPTAPLLLPPTVESNRLIARVARVPLPIAADIPVLARSGDGRTLARVNAHFDPGAATAEAKIELPSELTNQLDQLVLEGPATAGAVMLLDERWRRRPVGMLAGDATTALTPLSGQLYYVQRALVALAEVREGDLKTLLSRELSVLILTDHVVADGPERDAISSG